ncbi:MAG: hypothetical protein CMF51_02160 [Legionellales bacterium]|nr:hypothetical protein [Legionellales bacterium]
MSVSQQIKSLSRYVIIPAAVTVGLSMLLPKLIFPITWPPVSALYPMMLWVFALNLTQSSVFKEINNRAVVKGFRSLMITLIIFDLWLNHHLNLMMLPAMPFGGGWITPQMMYLSVMALTVMVTAFYAWRVMRSMPSERMDASQEDAATEELVESNPSQALSKMFVPTLMESLERVSASIKPRVNEEVFNLIIAEKNKFSQAAVERQIHSCGNVSSFSTYQADCLEVLKHSDYESYYQKMQCS